MTHPIEEGGYTQASFNKSVWSILQNLARNPGLDKKDAKQAKTVLDAMPVSRLETEALPRRRGIVGHDKSQLIPPPRTNPLLGQDITPQAAKEFGLIYQNKIPVGVRSEGNDEFALRTLLTAIRSVASGAGLSNEAVIELLRRNAHKSLLNVIENHVKAGGSLESLWWAMQMMAIRSKTPMEAGRKLQEILSLPVLNATQFAYDVLGLSIDKCGVLTGEKRKLHGFLSAAETIIMFLHQHLPNMAREEDEALRYVATKMHLGAVDGSIVESQRGFHSLLQLLYTYDDQIVQATAHLADAHTGEVKHSTMMAQKANRRARPLHEVVTQSEFDSVGIAEAISTANRKTAESNSLEEAELMFKTYLTLANDELAHSAKKAVKSAIHEIRTQAVTNFQPMEGRAKERSVPNELNLRDARMGQSPRFRESERPVYGQQNYRRGNFAPQESGFRYGRTWPDQRTFAQPRGVAAAGGGAWGRDQAQQQQRAPRACFLCSSADHLWRDCVRFPGETLQREFCPTCLAKGQRLRHRECAERQHVEIATIDAPVSARGQPRYLKRKQPLPARRRQAARDV